MLRQISLVSGAFSLSGSNMEYMITTDLRWKIKFSVRGW